MTTSKRWTTSAINLPYIIAFRSAAGKSLRELETFSIYSRTEKLLSRKTSLEMRTYFDYLPRVSIQIEDSTYAELLYEPLNLGNFNLFLVKLKMESEFRWKFTLLFAFVYVYKYNKDQIIR